MDVDFNMVLAVVISFEGAEEVFAKTHPIILWHLKMSF